MVEKYCINCGTVLVEYGDYATLLRCPKCDRIIYLYDS